MPKCKFLKKGFKVEQRGKITVSSKICQKGAQLVLLLGKTQAKNIFWGSAAQHSMDRRLTTASSRAGATAHM